MADGIVTVWQQPNGMWRWRWEPDLEGSGTVLVSHSPYDTLEEAEQTARESYPEAKVVVPDPETETAKSRPRWVRWVGVLLLVLLLTAVVRRRSARPGAGSAGTAARARRPGMAQAVSRAYRHRCTRTTTPAAARRSPSPASRRVRCLRGP